MPTQSASTPVWDPFIRTFHWSLVLSYLIAWVTAESVERLHEQSGYFILALLGLRIVWGLIGTPHARFSDFVYSPRNTLRYLASLLSGQPPYYRGHNPAGGWMVIALIICLLATAVSGIMIAEAHEELWEELHEGVAELSLLLVVLHLGGVVTASWLHRENLVKAMLSGRKAKRHSHV